MDNKIWVVGQLVGESWEFQGVFSSEEKALSACRNVNYFIGPASMDEEMPQETLEFWPGAYYPI